MEIKKNAIVKLEDGNNYIVVDIMDYRGTDYYYLLGTKEDSLLYAFCEVATENGKTFFKPTGDAYTTKKIATLFADKLRKDITQPQ